MQIDWAGLRRRAHAQHGLLTRRQCLEAGMSRDALAWRVTSRRWVRVHQGVFQTTPGRVDWRATAVAGLLYALSGEPAADAALRGATAAHVWGLVPVVPPVIHLVVPQRRSVSRQSGLQVKRSMRWDDLVDDRAWPWRTTVAATVLDAATEAEGAQSGAEVLYLRDVERAHGLPRSVSQSPSDAGRRRWHDHEYTAYRLIVEVDGRLGHEQWSDRVRDGRRDRLLLGADRAIARVFWADVAVTPCRTAHDIAVALAARGWTGRVRPCRRPGCGA